MPAPPPAPGLGGSGAPALDRISSLAAAAAAAPARPIALRRSSSFGLRPGSGAGSFGGRSLGRTGSMLGLNSRSSSYADLSNRGVREPLLTRSDEES